MMLTRRLREALSQGSRWCQSRSRARTDQPSFEFSVDHWPLGDTLDELRRRVFAIVGQSPDGELVRASVAWFNTGGRDRQVRRRGRRDRRQHPRQHPAPPAVARAAVTEPRERSWLEIQWRKSRNPPPPVLRAVLANLAVAIVGGVLILAYDLLTPGADLAALIALYVVVVIVSGSLLTYLWVELPTGAGAERRRSGWAAVLGLFAAVPIVYLVLVVLFQVIRPLLG